LSISQNSALFSILGTIYGGDGRTTFGLPDLRGRVMVDDGNGPGLTPRAIGAKIGQEAVTLSQQQVGIGTSAVVKMDSASGSSGFATTSLSVTQPHTNMQPFQTVKCIIAIQGFMPSSS